MINILVARFNDERKVWQRVVSINNISAKVGCSYHLPEAIQGTLAGQAAKSSVDYFRGQVEAVEINYDFNGNLFRVTKF